MTLGFPGERSTRRVDVGWG
jgi:hypothetical protein